MSSPTTPNVEALFIEASSSPLNLLYLQFLFFTFLEPAIFLTVISWSIINGSEVTTNLIISKVCSQKFNYTNEVCGNLSAGIYAAVFFKYYLMLVSN